MKLPRILTVRQALMIAVAAVVVAIFLKLFAPLATTVLLLTAFLGSCYAGILAWAPEFVKD